MNPQIKVICVKSKPAYDFRYVNRLYYAVEKHLTIPHTFYCLTDDATGVRCPCKPLPKGLKGWWAKLAIFRRDFLQGKVLYLDLDSLIVGNLDFIGDYQGDFAILRDFYRPEGYGSGIMLWNKPQPQVWDKWLVQGKPDDPNGDQGWIEKTIPDADRLQDLWPGKFLSYKADNVREKPKDAAVVAFHGWPKNEHFPDGHWVTETWRKAA